MSHPSGADTAHTAGPIGWIREIVLDRPDPWDLAGFWAGLLGGTPVQWYPGWVTLEPPPHGQRLSFQGGGGAARRLSVVPPVPPRISTFWSATSPMRTSVSSGQARCSPASMSRPRPGPGGEPVSWRVYRDPAGHPFCLVVR
jgi:glyoxalase superfamily protein